MTQSGNFWIHPRIMPTFYVSCQWFWINYLTVHSCVHGADRRQYTPSDMSQPGQPWWCMYHGWPGDEGTVEWMLRSHLQLHFIWPCFASLLLSSAPVLSLSLLRLQCSLHIMLSLEVPSRNIIPCSCSFLICLEPGIEKVPGDWKKIA